MTQRKNRIKVMLGADAVPVGELIFEVEGTRQSSMFRYNHEWLERKNRLCDRSFHATFGSPFFQFGR